MTLDTQDRTARRLPVWRIAGWGLIAALLALPAVAMLFTREMNWTPSDFVFAGLLLGGVGLLIELVVWKVRSPLVRAAIGAAVLLAALLVWAEGSVGLFH